LPAPREGEPIAEVPCAALRQRARENDQLHELELEAPQLLR
jgi:hypothetical protein